MGAVTKGHAKGHDGKGGKGDGEEMEDDGLRRGKKWRVGTGGTAPGTAPFGKLGTTNDSGGGRNRRQEGSPAGNGEMEWGDGKRKRDDQ